MITNHEDTGCVHHDAEITPVEPDLVRTSEGNVWTMTTPRVLSIAGTDPTGGAGTAADTKSITAAGGYAMCVTTALVAQNTRGVREIHQPPLDFLSAQLAAVSDDVTIDAVKTGMLGSADMIATVGDWLDAHRPPILVVDPVMIATSGDRLLAPEAEYALGQFCLRASVITPNIGELGVLTGNAAAADEQAALAQARSYAEKTGVAVVVKTGHLHGNWATNHWVSPDGSIITVPSSRIDTTSTHGTGCSLSSALATRLASGQTPAEALTWTTEWLHEAIAHGAALQVGQGNGPVDHAHRARRLAAAADPRPWQPMLGRQDLEPVDAVVAPVGPHTAALWQASSAITSSIETSGFVQRLIAGTLSRDQFNFYLDQDALYLVGYARALATVGVKAPQGEQQAFWGQASATCIIAESELHHSFLGHDAQGEPGPVTAAYTNFLIATSYTKPYLVGACAVLPCFWLYAHTGGILPAVPDEHPYAAWLDTYRDPAFVESTTQLLGYIEQAFADASADERQQATGAYLTACRHELEFFEQATRR